MEVPLKEVAGSLLNKSNDSIKESPFMAQKDATKENGGNTTIAKNNTPRNNLVDNHFLEKHNTIYSSNSNNSNQYKSKNYRPKQEGVSKSNNIFEIGNLLKTSFRNDIAAKKEEKELREREINELKENLVIQYELADEAALASRYKELKERGPEVAPKAKLIKGLYYQFTLRLLILKDVIDFFWDLAALITAATVVVALGLLLIKAMFTICMYVFVTIFNKLNGLSFSIKQWLLFRIIPVFLESLPLVGALPLGSTSFAYSILVENRFRKNKEHKLQSLLNEKHKIELKYLEEKLSSSNRASVIKIKTKSTSVINSIGSKLTPKTNMDAWKNMVEGSDQNITKITPKLS
jgi:hypothetical protein